MGNSRRAQGKPLAVKSTHRIHVGGYVFDPGDFEGYHTVGVRCADGRLAPWYYRPEGNEVDIHVRSKAHHQEPMYLLLSDGVPQRTDELIPGVLLRDVASDGTILGLEVLGPVTAEQLTQALSAA